MSIEVDFSNLHAIAGGDMTFVAGLLMRMQKSLPEAFEGMEKSHSEQDWPQLKAVAHKAKSTFAYLGLDNLRDLLKDIEYAAADESNLESVPNWIEEATIKGKDVLEAINAEIARIM